MGRRSGSGGIPHCCETEAEKAMTSRPGDHSGDLEHCLWLGNWEVLLTRAQQAGPLAATVPAMVLPSARLMLAVKSPGGQRSARSPRNWTTALSRQRKGTPVGHNRRSKDFESTSPG